MRAFRPARRIHGEYFSLACAPNAGGLKWTVVVSKKVSLKATERNRVKRRCRESLQKQLKGSDVCITLVFQAKPPAKTASFSAIRDDLTSLLERASPRGTMART